MPALVAARIVRCKRQADAFALSEKKTLQHERWNHRAVLLSDSPCTAIRRSQRTLRSKLFVPSSNVWHLRHGRGWFGLAATVGVLGLGSPWFVMPLLGAHGLRKTRRWGWFLSVGGCALYLPTPFMPVAAVGLGVLLSRRVRRIYFPTSAR